MTGSKGLTVSCLLSIFADKQDRAIKMNQHNSINTLELLTTKPDSIHLLYSQCFRLIKPVRRRYKLQVNAIVVLNNFYLYHCYKGSGVTHRQIFLFTGYYNMNHIKYYINLLLDKGYIEIRDIIKGINYYGITLAGLEVINYFNSTYQEQLSKWLQDHKIEL